MMGQTAMAACPALLDRSMDTILEQPQSLCEYAGKVVLVVNTASQCGYTPQYEGLEALYRKYKRARPGGARLPVERLRRPGAGLEQGHRRLLRQPVRHRLPDVREDASSRKNPLFADLAKATGQAPRWNFHKYLVDRGGAQVQSFDTRVAPDDPKLVAAIERLLQPQ